MTKGKHMRQLLKQSGSFYLLIWTFFYHLFHVCGLTCSGSTLGGDFSSGGKLPKVNWSHHAHAHNNFSGQNEFLSSNFLFSLPAQKLHIEQQLGER